MDKNKNSNELEVCTANPLREFYGQRGLKYSPKAHLIANAMFGRLLKESIELRKSLTQEGGRHE